MGKNKSKRTTYNVDFEGLERRAGNYHNLSGLEKEIIDKMITLNNSESNSTLNTYQKAALDLVYAVMAELTDKQREVIKLYFGLTDDGPMTENQIAEKLGITQQGVHDLKNRAINAIKKRTNLNKEAINTIKDKESE